LVYILSAYEKQALGLYKNKIEKTHLFVSSSPAFVGY